MNAPTPDFDWTEAQDDVPPIFDMQTRSAFGRNYPETPHRLHHNLDHHPLLEIGSLSELAEQLPERSIEYNRGDLPIGVDGKPESNGLSIGETIREVHEANSWAVLKNIEQVPDYRALLHDLLGEIRHEVERRTGRMLTPQGFIFISSPDAVTPYHFDPEHNILLQIAGSKVMTQFPAGDPRFAPDEVHETYHLGGPRELTWDDTFLEYGCDISLDPGQAVYVPVMAPHFVRNGPHSSISLSITWRSEWSYAESGARCFNSLLRRWGFHPGPTRRWPESNRGKDIAFRAYRRLFGPVVPPPA